MHCKSAQTKLASHKKISRGKVSRRSLVTSAKKINFEKKKERSVVREKITSIGHPITTPPFINLLS